MKHLFGFFAVLVVTGLSARGMALLRDGQMDVVQRPGTAVRINWTAGYASASAAVDLPRIINARTDPDFGQPGTVRSLSEARERAHAEARSRAERRLLALLGKMSLNSEMSLLERLRKDRRLRDRFGTVYALFQVRSRRTGEGRVSIELAVPFRGSRGLYTLLVDERYATEAIPETETPAVEDRITGIVVDATQLRGFRPSLEPRLYSQEGRRFYGPETLRRRCAIARGAVSYARNREEAMRGGGLGLNPYYTFAIAALGDRKTDLVLAHRDVTRILGSASGRRALQACRVVVLPP